MSIKGEEDGANTTAAPCPVCAPHQVQLVWGATKIEAWAPEGRILTRATRMSRRIWLIEAFDAIGQVYRSKQFAEGASEMLLNFMVATEVAGGLEE